MHKPLIVGVDPGNTSAVAALNLEGEIELLESERELPREQIIRMLVETGKPVLIACDTAKMPSTVEKIASSLGAEKFVPEEDIDRDRKNKLGEGDNSHEIDAVASARHAFRNQRKKIRKIKEVSERNGTPIDETAEKYFSDRVQDVKKNGKNS